MKSPLTTHNYYFPVTQVVADPNFPNEANVDDVEYDIATNILKAKDNERQYQVVLELKSKPQIDESDGEKPIAYKVNLVAIGTFEVHPKWEDPDKLVRINAASILYSASREFLITITARGPYGSIMLPTVSFNDTQQVDKEEVEET